MEKLINIAKHIQGNFKNFYLSGGTAIMLKFNHRESYDLDFFSQKFFSFLRISAKFRKIYKIDREEMGVDNIDFYIEDIKVSFVFFPFENVEPLENFKGIKKASDYDIFLNKIYSAGRRIEPKDPFDCAFLYRKYKWNKEKIEEDFEKKFHGQSYKIYLGAILSFDDYPQLPEWVKDELLKLL